MKNINLDVTARKELGKKASKELRKNEGVPCVLYGGGKNHHFHAVVKDFRHLLYTPNEYIVNLNIDGTSKVAILKDVQFHPVTDIPTHIDFLEIDENKEVEFQIPVQLEGFSKGVQEGGKIQILKRKLKVKGLVSNFPDRLKIDVTNLDLGKSLKIKELNFENITLLDVPNSVVCAVKLTRAAKGAATDEEAEGEATKEEL